MARTEDPTQTLKYRLIELATKPVVDWLVNDLLPRSEIIYDSILVTFIAGALEKIVEDIKAGCVPVDASNHTSQIDLYGQLKVGRIIIEEAERQGLTGPKGFYFPVAASMESGHQGPLLKAVQGYMRKKAQRDYTQMIRVIRPKDKDVYGMKGNNQEFLDALNNCRETNSGLMVLPEGSVQGGRKHNLLSIHRRRGMKVPEDRSLDYISGVLTRKHIDATFIPMAIVGGCDVFTSWWKVPTHRAILASYGLHDPHLMSVTVGMPIRLSELRARPDIGPRGSVAEPIMRSIASLLPDDRRNLRGVYTQALRTS